MRLVGLLIVLTSAVVLYCWGRPGGASAILRPAQPASIVSTDNAKVDFATHVEPLLKARCDGCHFAGGKMYEKLPFDRPETIRKLGTKLFTRISDENDRKVIREFLAQD